MTVRELLKALEGASPDATVEMEVYDDDIQCCSGCDNCGLSVTSIGSVNYDAETETITLREA